MRFKSIVKLLMLIQAVAARPDPPGFWRARTSVVLAVHVIVVAPETLTPA